MYKVVIFSNNFYMVNKSCKIFFNNFNNLQLVGLVSTYSELLELYNNSKIDMIIISESDMNDLNIQNLLKNIQNKIIFFESSQVHKNSKYILYLCINDDSTLLYNQFKNFILKTDNRSIRKKVLDILENLNFDFKLIGTNYLLDAIIYSYKNKHDYRFENLEKQIYPYVAKLHHASNQNVKFSIVRSVNNMSAHINSSNSKNRCINFCENVTPKLVISEIVNHI